MDAASVDGRLEPWEQAHAELVKLAEQRAGLDFEECCWLLLAHREGTYVRLGYGSFAEYVERVLGYSPRLAHEKLRVAESLETLPAVARELAAGRVCFSAVRELSRVATRFTEEEWLAAGRGKTVREVERMVSGHRPGSRPGDARDSSAVRHVIRLQVSAEALATFREAMAHIRRTAGGPLDDDAAILLLARQILEGPRDDGRASYQVAITVCEECERGFQHGRGGLVEVSAEVVAMAGCDAQDLGARGDATHVGCAGRARAKQDVTPAARREVLRRDGGRCRVPGCRHATFVDVHHVEPRAEGGAHEPENLITLCAAHHRAIHAGRLQVERDGSSLCRFRHADGSDYGRPASAGIADLRAKAFRALRALGFRECEVRKALETTHVGTDLDLEGVVRASLQALAS